jgi:transposase
VDADTLVRQVTGRTPDRQQDWTVSAEAVGRPPKLSDAQAAQVEQVLLQGAKANGFATDLWTLDRVAQVIQRVTGVRLARASTWRLLVGRLGWSLQRPERQARERDEEAIARWVAYEWPRIKKMTCAGTPSGSSTDDRAAGHMGRARRRSR